MDKATYPVVRFLLKWVCPVLVSVVFIFGILDFVGSYTAEPIAEPVTEPVAVEPKLKVEGLDMEVEENVDFESVILTPVTENSDNN